MTYFARKIDYFIAVAQEGSLTAAASKRFVTVPPICKLISELEQEIGKKLFSRKGRGMELTSDGVMLYKELIAHYNAINDAFSKINSRKVIKFDVYGPFPKFIEDLCHYIFKSGGGCDIEVSRRNLIDDKNNITNADFIYRTSKLNDLLNYDVIISQEKPIILYSKRIGRDEVFNLPFVQNSNLADTEIYKDMHKKLVAMGYNDRVIGIDNDELIREIVMQGDALSLITPSFIRTIDPEQLDVIEVASLCGFFSHYVYIKNSGTVSYESTKDMLSSTSCLDWS